MAVGPRSGIRGAGCHDLNSLKWSNKIKVLGTTALQITEKEAEKRPTLLRECFKHSVNRQILAGQLKKDIATSVCAICPSKCDRDIPCSSCLTVIRKKFDMEAAKASSWTQQSDQIRWDGIQFPSGIEDFEMFSRKNPHICISVYRAAEDKGDVFLTYRSEPTDRPRSEQAMVHIVSVTRLNTAIMELETHFMPVTDLNAFSRHIYEYNAKDGNIKTQYGAGEQ